MVNHDHILVTAKVRERALVADSVTETTGHRLEQLVTARMAQAVVDRPKSIEVDHEKGGWVGVRLGVSKTRRETLFKTPPAIAR